MSLQPRIGKVETPEILVELPQEGLSLRSRRDELVYMDTKAVGRAENSANYRRREHPVGDEIGVCLLFDNPFVHRFNRVLNGFEAG